MTAIIIRDEKQVYNEVKNPAILYDKRDYIRHKVGEKVNILRIYQQWRQKYIEAGFQDIADDLAVLELPASQELMDDLFQSDGKFKAFVQKHLESDETQLQTT